MRLPCLFVFAFILPLPLSAAPPVNDNFAARIPLVGNSQTVNGSSVEATLEAGENSQNSYFGATVWWSWLPTVTGWARVDTAGSSFDTVMQISTGTTLATQTYAGFNRQSPIPALGFASSVTFMATAGTIYNIAVGGWDFFGAEDGDITMHIVTGTAAKPAFFPAILTLTPAFVNVTNAAVNVTAAFTIQAASGNGTGIAGIGFGWENSFGNGPYKGTPANWDTSRPQSGSPQVAFSVPRYTAPGPRMLWFKIAPPGGGRDLIYSGPNGGSGYALPPATAQLLEVANTGPVDADPPNLTAFTIAPGNADVTTAPASLQVSATLTDALAGVAWVKVSLMSSLSSGFATTLTRTAGTTLSGTWTGTIGVPLLYPTGNYSVLVETADATDNQTDYGEFSMANRAIPDGNRDIPIVGGSAYERWAYTTWFQPGDSLTGILDDADGDGKPNLISYAFNLNPRGSGGSPGSLPVVQLTGTGATRHLRITYLRRKASANSGLTYSPQFTSAPSGVWQTVSGGIPTNLGGDWESVVVDDPVNVSADTRRLARIKVEYAAP